MADLKERAKLRASQQRKLEHAEQTIADLIDLHMPGDIGEREKAELFMMTMRLQLLIKNQHVVDRRVAGARMKEYATGDY